MLELTIQKRHEIQQAGWPPEITNPDTGETFVLLSKEMFTRVRGILEEEDEIAAIEEMAPLISEVLNSEAGLALENA